MRDSERRIHSIEKDGTLYFLLNALLGSYNRRTDIMKNSGSAELLTAINNLTKEVRDFMATQEERLQAVMAQLATIQSGVDAIQQAVDDFKANNPALEDEVAGIEAAVAALVADVAVPAPPPDPEPAPEPTPEP